MASIGSSPAERHDMSCQLLSVVVAGQQFGIAIDVVRDVLGPQKVTIVPLAAPETSACSIFGVASSRSSICVVDWASVRPAMPRRIA